MIYSSVRFDFKEMIFFFHLVSDGNYFMGKFVLSDLQKNNNEENLPVQFAERDENRLDVKKFCISSKTES